MIGILTLGNFVGVQILELEAIVFIPLWLIFYYSLDFWINRAFVFPVEFTCQLARRFIIYSSLNWAVTSLVSFYTVAVIGWGFIGSTVVVLVLFPLRYLVQKHFVFK
jgi:hypothetical protein